MSDYTIKLFGKTILEKRSFQPVGSISDTSTALLEALNKQFGVYSKTQITVDNALTISAVWRAVNVLSGTIASLPLHVFQETENSRKQTRVHSVAKLLKNPSKLMNAYMFRETMQAILLMYGNAYALIRRDASAIPVELILVHPDDVYPVKSNGAIFYQMKLDDSFIIVAAKDMIHLAGLGFNGIVGKSPIRVFAESMSVSISAQTFGKTFFENGAHISGVLETPNELTNEAYERVRVSWKERNSGLSNTGNTAILEGGLKFSKIGVPPEEAQFLQTRQFQVSEIARMYGVQPHLLMDLERSTNNNIEHQGIEFVIYTLTQWISRWEAELNAKLFSAGEAGSTYCEFNLNGLLRGDAKSRAEYYRSMTNIAAMNPNEIRALENMPAYEGGEKFYIQGAMVPIDKVSEFYDSKNKKPNETNI